VTSLRSEKQQTNTVDVVVADDGPTAAQTGVAAGGEVASGPRRTTTAAAAAATPRRRPRLADDGRRAAAEHRPQQPDDARPEPGTEVAVDDGAPMSFVISQNSKTSRDHEHIPYRSDLVTHTLVLTTINLRIVNFNCLARSNLRISKT